MTKISCQCLHAMMLSYCCFTVSSAAFADKLSPTTRQERSAGCGITHVGSGSFETNKIRILNQDRTYHINVPRNYDPDRSYPLIFKWHGSGGNGLSGGLDIEYISGNNAIIVSADGLNNNWDAQTDSADLLMDSSYSYLQFNTDPVDLLFFDRMLESIEEKYCVDRKRVFSYGYSLGGAFSNLLACERGNVLRASAAIAGWLRGGNCIGKVATWLLHDSDDHVVPIEKGISARNRAASMNGCTPETVKESEICIKYQGCEDAPVIWCESKGFGHKIRSDYAPEQVWKFFMGLL